MSPVAVEKSELCIDCRETRLDRLESEQNAQLISMLVLHGAEQLKAHSPYLFRQAEKVARAALEDILETKCAPTCEEAGARDHAASEAA